MTMSIKVNDDSRNVTSWLPGPPVPGYDLASDNLLYKTTTLTCV